MSYSISVLQNVAELRNYTPASTVPVGAAIMGLNYPTDKLYYVYIWDPFSVAADNVPSIVAPYGAPVVGRWVQVDVYLAGWQMQTNSDWAASSGVTQILNKPTIPSAQVNSDWAVSSGVAQVLNKPIIQTIQRIRAQTNISGLYTWTFPVTYGAGVVPVIGVSVEDNSSASWNHQLISVSNTAVTIQLVKTTAVTILGISVLGIATNPQAFVHLTAVAP